MEISENLKDWLLNSNPWVEYNTRIELLNQSLENPEVINAKEKMIKHPLVQAILNEIGDWPGYALKRHNDAKHLTHKLSFLTDIGLRKEDNDNLNEIVDKIFKDQSNEGAFQILANIPVHFGGSGNDEKAWMLCDTPTVLYSVIKLGYSTEKSVEKAIKHIISLIRENGWPCVASPKFGKFKGPGKKDDPCPYANLISLKVLANHPKWKDDNVCKIGTEILLSLWNQRTKRKPFLFGMGTDFKKLKAPLIWYDILHVTDVLTRFDWLKNDERLLEMINIIESKADENGRFAAESVWRAYKDWDFGQKKEPSPWISYLVYCITNRIK